MVETLSGLSLSRSDAFPPLRQGPLCPQQSQRHALRSGHPCPLTGLDTTQACLAFLHFCAPVGLASFDSHSVTPGRELHSWGECLTRLPQIPLWPLGDCIWISFRGEFPSSYKFPGTITGFCFTLTHDSPVSLVAVQVGLQEDTKYLAKSRCSTNGHWMNKWNLSDLLKITQQLMELRTETSLPEPSPDNPLAKHLPGNFLWLHLTQLIQRNQWVNWVRHG